MRRAAAVTGAAAVLLAPGVWVASAAGGAAAGSRLAAGARADLAGGWGAAEEVPGTAALNKGGGAAVLSVSCASAGACSAGGIYTDSSGHVQALVVSEVHGGWGTAEEVPGTAALNVDGSAEVSSVSCASAGNCSAGGIYTDSTFHSRAFVVSQVGGRWGKAEEIPGLAALDTGFFAEVSSVSCASPGNCSAGGAYSDSSAGQHAFVVSQVGGRWGTAEQVPGTTGGGSTAVDSVSCASAGNCTAGGTYNDSRGNQHAFVISQVGGKWGTAKTVAATLDTRNGGELLSVSCAAAGTCGAGGTYADADLGQAFVVSQVRGKWGTAEEVPGTASLNTGGNAAVYSVSCASAGNCSAGGDYADNGQFQTQAFVVSQVGGRWGTAEEIPGTATLNTGGNAQVTSVSCAAAGTCSAGGFYHSNSGEQAFVVSQVGGKWGTAKTVAAALNTGATAAVLSLSCARAGTCSAGGLYYSSSTQEQAFVVNKVNQRCSLNHVGTVPVRPADSGSGFALP
jgi:D-alanine-D-alanine ligase-like ATP-grasp enzyme